jgi:hypothetical protein
VDVIVFGGLGKGWGDLEWGSTRDHHRSPPGHQAMSLTCTHKNLYPQSWVRVFVGTGMGWQGWAGCKWAMHVCMGFEHNVQSRKSVY